MTVITVPAMTALATMVMEMVMPMVMPMVKASAIEMTVTTVPAKTALATLATLVVMAMVVTMAMAKTVVINSYLLITRARTIATVTPIPLKFSLFELQTAS